MLVAGCSHAAGSEIDGTEDSDYNRQQSFGNLVAKELEYEAINIASGAATNPTIARNILEWIDENYLPDEMHLRVIVAWTESSRIELPHSTRIFRYYQPNIAWESKTDLFYQRVNLGYPGSTEEEKRTIPGYQKFVANNLVYFELLTINLILQIQFYLKMKQLDYIMCSTMPMFSDNTHINHYINKVDESRYLNFNNDAEAFFWKYRNAGYTNPKAKYWHHNEVPHQLFAEQILQKWKLINGF